MNKNKSCIWSEADFQSFVMASVFV